jgi:hypothetical protein
MRCVLFIASRAAALAVTTSTSTGMATSSSSAGPLPSRTDFHTMWMFLPSTHPRSARP